MTHRPASHLGGYARSFWQIPPRGWLNVARRTYAQSTADNLGLLAAGVAFYIFLAFVPLLASIVLLYGLAADPQQVATHILMLARSLPSDVASVIATQLEAVTSGEPARSSWGLLMALLLSLYGTTRGSSSMIAALNVVYGEAERRSFLMLTGLTFAMAAGAVAVGVMTLLAISAMALLGTIVVVGPFVAAITRGLAWLAVLLVSTLLVAAVYRYAPCRANARWSWLTPGATLASVGSFLGSLGFGIYVSRISDYGATYGALGAVVTFLMWLYLSCYILLLGAQLNAEVERQTAVDTTEGAPRPMGLRNAEMADQVETGPAVTAKD